MIRDIIITPVLNGFICKVGCQQVVFNSINEMTSEIETYYRNPEETEARFIKKAVNKKVETGVTGDPQACSPMYPAQDSNPCCESPRPCR